MINDDSSTAAGYIFAGDKSRAAFVGDQPFPFVANFVELVPDQLAFGVDHNFGFKLQYEISRCIQWAMITYALSRLVEVSHHAGREDAANRRASR